MLNISQTSSLLQSLGVNDATAQRAATRTVQATNDYALKFLQELHDALQELSGNMQPSATADASQTTTAPSTVSLATPTPAVVGSPATAELEPSSPAIKPPFDNFEEFRQWEKTLGKTFAPDYQPPDYLRLIALPLQGGDQDAFKRYVFFKDNPQYANDYQAIRSGALSSFPTDGSTLVKTNLAALEPDVANFYRSNPATLRMVEGFAIDPTLYKRRLDGDTQGMNDPSWLMTHQWTPNGIKENNNGYTSAIAPFIGLDGQGANNYRLATYSDGLLVDASGQRYDPITGEAQA